MPDLLLLDGMMPILDGIDVVRALRADRRTADLPIILMTALPHVVPADVQAATCAVLHKPFSPAVLFSAIASCLGDEG